MKKRNFKLSRYIALLLVLLTVSAAFLVGTFANTKTPEEIKAENEALYNEKYPLLLALQGDSIPNIRIFLTPYQTALDSTFIDDEKMSQESTAELIKLYYQQAVSTSDVAKIYFKHFSSYNANASEELLTPEAKAFRSILTTIQNAEANGYTAEELADLTKAPYGVEETVHGLCAEMQVAIYTQKLNSLYDRDADGNVTDTKGSEVDRKIQQAITDIKKSDVDVSVDSTAYQEIFDTTKTAVAVQRNQDLAINAVKEAFEILCPDSDINDYQMVSDVINQIEDDDTTEISAMNGYVKAALTGLMDELSSGTYVEAYYEGLKNDVEAAVDNAVDGEGNPTVVDFGALFDNHADSLYRAQAKDEILNYINTKNCKDDERLAEDLETEYNGVGGEIDTADDLDAVDFEVEKAKRRADLYEQYDDTLKAVIGKNGNIGEIESNYNLYDSAIDGATDDETLKNAYNTGMAQLEIAEFNALYGAVADPEQNADKTRAEIEAAIEALNKLNPVAKDDGDIKLAAINLTARYKESLKDEISSILGENNDYADALIGQVNALSNIESVISDGELIISKAEAIDSILDADAGIVKDSFSEKEKSDMAKTVTDACNDIVNATSDPAKIASDAILSLEKQEAMARINAKIAEKTVRAQEVKDEIQNIKNTAFAAIEGAQSGVEGIADAAIFDIQKQFEIQALIDKYSETVEKIEGMGYLSPEAKEAYKAKAKDAYKSANDGIEQAEIQEKINGAQNGAAEAFGDIIESGTAANNAARNQQIADAEKDLEEKYQEVIGGIDDADYISDEKKQELKDEAQKALEDAKAELEASNKKDDIVKALDDAEAEFNKQKSDNSALDSSEKQTQSNTAQAELESKRQELYNAVDNMGYLDTAQKQALKERIDSIFDEAKADLTVVENSEDIQNAKDEALESFDKLGAEAEQTNLVNAKTAARTEMQKTKQELEAKIDGLKYLDEEQKAQLKAELEAQFLAAEDKIASAENARAVELLLAGILDGFDTKGKEAVTLDDGACVDMLKPAMISLGVLGIIEAIALIFLIQKRNALAFAAFVPVRPVFAALRVQPVTAWTLTVVMGLADAVMAVFIVYLSVQLWRQRTYAVDGGYSDEDFDDEFFRRDESELEPSFVPAVAPTVDIPKIEPDLTEAVCEPAEEPEKESEREPEPTVEKPVIAQPIAQKVKRKKPDKVRMAVINVDVLDAVFESDSTVTLDSLKEKGLVQTSSRCVKVLGRGEIGKPMKVVARKFSASAMKKILEAGGVVIIDEELEE